jgi:SET family sugar efflux transporter-like MFS transporter
MGYLMGLAALVEIPVIIIAGKQAKKYSILPLLMVGFLSATIFFIGTIFASQLWQLILLQIFNGIFIGIIASLGMILVQDLMPNQVGLASTLFNNTMQLSMLLASLAVAVLANSDSYYQVLQVCLVFCIVSTLLLRLFYNSLGNILKDSELKNLAA